MAHVGLALAISISAWVNAILLLCILLMRKSYRPQPGWFLFVARVALAVAAMGVCLWYLNAAPEVWFEKTFWQRVIDLSILVVAGMVTYFTTLLITGIRPKQLLLSPQHS